MNIGAIAIGSNSTRLLTRLENGLEDRAREDTKLFSGLNEDGNLSDEAMDRTVRAVLRLKKRAIQFGAEYIILLATSATRDAGNSEEFSRRLLAGTGLRLKIISGNKEAELAFRAASAGSHCAVLDIGGADLWGGRKDHQIHQRPGRRQQAPEGRRDPVGQRRGARVRPGD